MVKNWKCAIGGLFLCLIFSFKKSNRLWFRQRKIGFATDDFIKLVTLRSLNANSHQQLLAAHVHMVSNVSNFHFEMTLLRACWA